MLPRRGILPVVSSNTHETPPAVAVMKCGVLMEPLGFEPFGGTDALPGFQACPPENVSPVFWYSAQTSEPAPSAVVLPMEPVDHVGCDPPLVPGVTTI